MSVPSSRARQKGFSPATRRAILSDADRLLTSALHLFALAGFAIAQPLFHSLARHPLFLLAYEITPAEIVVLTLVLLFVPALLAWGAELAAGFLGPRARRFLHRFLLVLLVALLLLPALKHFPKSPGPVLLVVAVVFGCLLSVAYFRFAFVRFFISILAVAPIFLATGYTVGTPLVKFWSGNGLVATPAGSAAAPSPVVMVIFDDFPVFSLMDENRRIDSIRYPAFAALAKQSTWFRNTTTVHDRTRSAVPAILTGSYITHRLPTPVDYPRHLFSLLPESYRMNVHESVVPRYIARNGPDGRRAGFLDRLRMLYFDISVLYLHIILPGDLAVELPPLKAKWKDFTDIPGTPSRGARTLRKERFNAFLDSIEPCEKHCLHFLHILLPHGPWYYLPSGKTYFRDDVFDKKTLQGTEHEWPLIEIYQRHLLQVAFVDNLLGELIARLQALDMFDRSLIVVTADHGRSFWPGELGRNTLKAAHPEDILTVPLFIKAPYQKTGSVSDRNVETIDILPTIADLLKLDSDWTFDGCSLFAAGCAERREKILIRGPKRRGSFPPDIGLRTDSLKRKIALFGSGAKPHGLFAVGGYLHLVGRNVSEIGVQGGAAAGVSVSVLSPLNSPASNDYVPARVAALLQSAEEIQKTPQVAVAVNGVIQAVVPAVPDDRSRWVVSAMVPEESLRQSGNGFQFFLVQGETEKPRLAQIPLR